MSGRKIIFSACLAIVISFLFGLLYFRHFGGVFNFGQQVTIEWAKSSVREFEKGMIKVIENRAYLQRTIFEDDETQNEKAGFERCFISSPEGLVHLIPTSDPLFQKETTETFYPNGEFVRVSPISMTTENFENCTSCHQHEKFNVGDFIGAIVIRISNVKG